MYEILIVVTMAFMIWFSKSNLENVSTFADAKTVIIKAVGTLVLSCLLALTFDADFADEPIMNFVLSAVTFMAVMVGLSWAGAFFYAIWLKIFRPEKLKEYVKAPPYKRPLG